MGRRSLLVGLMIMLAMASWVSPAYGQVDDQNCDDFASQKAAQEHLRADPSDPDQLDGNDDDGIACESNPAPRDEVPVQGAISSGGTGTPAPLAANVGSSRAPRVRIDGREYAAQCGPNTLTVAGQGTQGGGLTVHHTFTINCAASAGGGLPRTGQMILQWTGIGVVLVALGWMLWAGDRFLGGPRRRAGHARR